MRMLIHRLASMKIAVTLLVVMLVVMAAGTIVESAKGREAAWESVYYARWFLVIEALFAINVLAAVVDYFPWGSRRTGFAITHGALLVILAGAMVTYFWKVEGHLPIYEGESADRFVREATREGETVVLPFAIHLDRFEIDRYPGTMRPAMFRSRVTVEERGSGARRPAVIEMNHELAHGGWKFFQSSYEQQEGRNRTVLAVSKDPGQPIVFIGYGLLVIGMITVLSTRIRMARAIPRSAALAILIAAGGPLHAAWLPDAGTAETLRRLPVQDDGRAMPLDTVARQAVWKVTGKTVWRGIDPTAVVVGWAFAPRDWANEPMIRVAGDLAGEAGIPTSSGYASFQNLVQNPKVRMLMQQAREEEQQDRKLHGVLASANKLEERLVWMNRFFDHSVFAVIPHPTDPKGGWSVPARLDSPEALLAIAANPPAAPSYPSRTFVDRELNYNAFRPSRVAWIVLAVALVLAVGAMRTEKRWMDLLSLSALACGWIVMTWGIATRWALAGRIPASNMYESLLFLAWGVGTFALLAFLVLRNRLIVLNAAAMSALTMALTDLLPIDGYIHPVAPVLANTPWLAIHVPIIMVSYSILALGVFFAHMQIGIGIFAPKRQDLVARMNELLYWYVHIGTIFLIAGIMTGSIWASFSWGRYWGWDPKEVWSLVAFLAYLAILHARFAGYIGPFGVAAISIAAFWMILMTYLGVNFVLTSGLHSYGFGGSSVLNAMVVVAALEVAFVLAGYFAYRRESTKREQAVPA